VHEIEYQRWLPGAVSNRTKDIFIDTSSLQIITVSETLPKGGSQEFHYSDYRAVGGVMMPYSIAEESSGQQIWAVQLTRFNLNTGLQATSFAIQ
jgi:hypothetical protein